MLLQFKIIALSGYDVNSLKIIYGTGMGFFRFLTEIRFFQSYLGHS